MGSHIRLLNHRLGDLVDVARQRKYGMPDSESGKGYVVGCNVDNISYDVQYILNNKVSKDVVPTRVSPTKIDTFSR